MKPTPSTTADTDSSDCPAPDTMNDGVIFPATQLTEEQAIAFAENKRWESLDLKTRALFQMHQKRLCMPFDVFHEAVEKTLGRPVFAHEFGLNPRLKDELIGLANAPTLDQIIALLPQDKTQ
jgi:hypothetical protein